MGGGKGGPPPPPPPPSNGPSGPSGKNGVFPQLPTAQAQWNIFTVPKDAIGAIIGPRGDNIKRLESQFCCRVHVDKHSEPNPDGTREVRVDSDWIEAIQDCRRDIDGMIQQLKPANGAESGASDTMSVPKEHLGKVIGPGGENVRWVQKESNCNVTVDKSDGPDPMREIKIEGTKEGIEKAKQMIQKMVDEEEAWHGPAITEIVQVPLDHVGLVIGPKGQTIRDLQREHNVKIQVDKDDIPEDSDIKTRKIEVTGAEKSVKAAKEAIEKLAAEGVQNTEGGGKGKGKGNELEIVIDVPKNLCGIIIGRNGSTINRIQHECRCDVQAKDDPDNEENRKVTIRGFKKNTEWARKMIEDLLEQEVQIKDQKEIIREEDVEIIIDVPKNSIGIVIGKRGQTIQHIQDKCKCRIQSNEDKDNEENRKVAIRGPKGACEEAQKMIDRLLGDHADLKEQEGDVITDTHKVDDAFMGFVIGQKGDTIRKIEKENHVKATFDKLERNDDGTKVLTLVGTEENVKKAKDQVDAIVDQHKKHLEKKKEEKDDEGLQPKTAVKTEFMHIPGSKCGMVIGRHGKNLQKTQDETHTEIIIAQDSDLDGNREVSITGIESDIAEAKKAIRALVMADTPVKSAKERGIWLDVPVDLIGRVIGKGGCNQRHIQQERDVTINIIQSEYDPPGFPWRRVEITGQSSHDCEYAKGDIEILVDEIISSRRHEVESGLGCKKGQMVVKEPCLPVVSGKNSNFMRRVRDLTGAWLVLAAVANPGTNEYNVDISAKSEGGVEKAKKMIMEACEGFRSEPPLDVSEGATFETMDISYKVADVLRTRWKCLQFESGCDIKVGKVQSEDSDICPVYLVGSAEEVEYATRLVEKHIERLEDLDTSHDIRLVDDAASFFPKVLLAKGKGVLEEFGKGKGFDKGFNRKGSFKGGKKGGKKGGFYDEYDFIVSLKILFFLFCLHFYVFTFCSQSCCAFSTHKAICFQLAKAICPSFSLGPPCPHERVGAHGHICRLERGNRSFASGLPLKGLYTTRQPPRRREQGRGWRRLRIARVRGGGVFKA